MTCRFNTAKRFGIEGNESVIPGMKAMIDRATELGVENVVMGMAHRGRLNVLCNVIRKPLELIFKEFAGTHFILDKMEKVDVDGDGVEDWSGSGDVKYHLGTNFLRVYPDGRKVEMSMLANPSHLEAVNPLVQGKARAKMFFLGDESGTGRNVMPVLLHGDAAFAGQGIVYETMTMSQLDNYKTGGTVHIVINNQVGFTTDPKDSRSTLYTSDLGKAFDCPIFHVNADDPETVVRAFRLAAEFRQKFHRDCIVDVVGYRRNGHNELDQPMFTQPSMYKVIAKHPTPLKVYQKSLISEGSFTQAEVEEVEKKVWGVFQAAYEKSPSYVSTKEEWLSSRWGNLKRPGQMSQITKTGELYRMLFIFHSFEIGLLF
jgi:2-oxoglutarate dehydrogenase E1 component